MNAKSSQRKGERLPSAWSLYVASLQAYRRDWKPYIGIILTIILPTAILSLLVDTSGDSTISGILQLITIVMNAALVWAIVRRLSLDKAPKVAEAYYDGSVTIVRFSLILVSIIIMLIPAMFGILLFGTTVLQASALGIGWQEEAISGFVGLLLASPSIYLMVRYLFAGYVTVQDGFRPIKSLKASRYVTLGYFWPIMARYILLIVFMAISSIPVALITFLIAQIHLPVLTLTVFQVLSSVVALPILFAYGYLLYQALETRALARKAQLDDEHAKAEANAQAELAEAFTPAEDSAA